MTVHQVVIAGGGPTGMMLAAELALAKVDVAIVERRPNHALAGSRGGGFHSRTIEVFDQRGVVDRFLAEGQVAQVATFASTVLDMSDFPTRRPYTLGIWQSKIERIMAAWIAELPVRIYYGREVTGFAQDESGVRVDLSEGQPVGARYLVGCDGGRSVVRKAAGIEFPGWEATRSNIIAEAEMVEEPELGVRHDALGRRMPDLDLTTTDGPVRVFELLHEATPALLNFGAPDSIDVAPWADRVRLFEAEYDGNWELPVLGVVTSPTAVLVRPDGYVAWVGDGTNAGLRDALTMWFGAPNT